MEIKEELESEVGAEGPMRSPWGMCRSLSACARRAVCRREISKAARVSLPFATRYKSIVVPVGQKAHTTVVSLGPSTVPGVRRGA